MLSLLAGLGPIIWIAFTAATISGFGSTIIGLTLAAPFYPLELLLPIFVILSCVFSAAILAGAHRHIDYRLFLGRILPFMGAGMAGGAAVARWVHGEPMKLGFAGLVLVLSVRELWLLRRGARAPSRPPRAWAAPLWLVAAGVVHGIYASGGPLLVLALGRLELPKAVFRSTLVAVWLVLNAALAAYYGWAGMIGREHGVALVVLVPVMGVGVAVGEWAHRRVNERGFRLIVFGMLLLASGITLARGLWAMLG